MKTYHETQVPWPSDRPRTKDADRVVGRFHSTSAAAGAERVEEALRQLDRHKGNDRVGEVWIYAQGQLGTRNRFLANGRWYDPGVVVTFDLDGKPYSIAADIYRNPGHNLAGIAAYIDGIRAQERHGIVSASEQLQFAALPAPGESSKRHWSDVLDIPPTSGADRIHAAYRLLAKTLHPDNAETGSTEAFVELSVAYTEALEEVGGAA
jgi:hypothetical protein